MPTWASRAEIVWSGKVSLRRWHVIRYLKGSERVRQGNICGSVSGRRKNTAKTVHQIPLYLLPTYHSYILIPTSRMEKPRARKVRRLTQGHMACRWQSWGPPRAVGPASLCGLWAMKPPRLYGEVLDACEPRRGGSEGRKEDGKT